MQRFRLALRAAPFILALFLAMSVPASAQAVAIDLPAQPLGPALTALAQQSGAQIVYAAELVEGKTAPPVSGQMTIEQALDVLLAGSGLQHRKSGQAHVIRRAQDAAADQELPEVTVTGERVERSLMDTASSVVVYDAQAIAARPSLETARGVLASVPNVTTSGTSNLAPAVRGVDGTGPSQGVDAFFSGTRPRLNVQIDGRPASYNEITFDNVGLWDAEQVEVFRGPQSTLQGRNAIAGAMVVKTRDPTFEYEAGGRAVGGNQDYRQGSVFLSGPILEDELAFRLAIDRATYDSFVPTPSYPGVDNPGDFESTTLRGKLLIKPKAAPGFSTLLTLNHSESRAPQTEHVGQPYGDLKSPFPTQAVFEPRATSGIMDNTWKIDDTFTFLNKLAVTDLNVKRLAQPGNGNVNIDGTEIVFEPRLAFRGAGGRLNGFGGLYFFRADQDETIDVFAPDDAFHDETRTAAVFGEATFAAFDSIDVTVGGRYEQEHRRRTGAAGFFTVDLDETYEAFLPKLGLAWHATEEVTLGTVVARGYNGGGAGFTFEPPFTNYTFEPEFVWAYEAYGRANLLGGALVLTGNVFYNDYKDMQLPFDLNPDPTIWAAVVRNADKAVTYGAEFGARWLARPGFEVFGNAGLLKTEVTSYAGSGIEGHELARAPAFTLDVGFSYRQKRGFYYGANARYSDAYYSDILNQARGKTDPYWLVNGNLGYGFGKVRTFVFVDNVFDDQTPILIEPGALPVDDTAIINRPRTFGVGIEVQL